MDYNIKPGTVLLVHSHSKLAKIIQNVQSKKDPISGYWNHSGILIQGISGRWYVYEATELPGRKFRGAVRPTPLEDYLESDRELLFLEPSMDLPIEVIEGGIFHDIGVPYDIPNLAIHQLVYYKLNIWLGRSGAKAKRKMVCHEYIQTAWNYMIQNLFPHAARAQVSAAYHNSFFIHKTAKQLGIKR